MKTNFKHQQPSTATLKRRRKTAKRDNIEAVREQVAARECDACRITTLLHRFGFARMTAWSPLDLAHLQGRGMGGNRDLSRDTTANTVLVAATLHTGGRYSLHGEYLEIEPLTDKGADGPCRMIFYEKLPSEVK